MMKNNIKIAFFDIDGTLTNNNKEILPSTIKAINKASEKLGNYRLDGATIYTTKEPCLMCMGALLSARIKKIYFGAQDKRFGTSALANENNFNHKCEIEGGILKETCEDMLTHFFKSIR